MYLIIRNNEPFKVYGLTAELYREAKSGLVTIINIRTQEVLTAGSWKPIKVEKF